MANHTGIDGVVKVGTVVVAEVLSFSVDESANTIDDSVLGDTWATHQVGMKGWSGSLTCHWDETDTTGQGALTVGASVTLNLYPEGATTGDTYLTGTATITAVAVAISGNDSMVSRTISFTGNGAATWGAAA